MTEKIPAAQPDHPWHDEGPPLEPENAAPVAASAPAAPAERSLQGLAAELKNLIRGERISRAKWAQPPRQGTRR